MKEEELGVGRPSTQQNTNYANDDAAIDNWVQLRSNGRHFNEIAERLRASGHRVAELDFSVGDQILDRFIDLPPYPHDMTSFQQAHWARDSNHIKAAVDGFASTCFGLIIQKKDAAPPE